MLRNGRIAEIFRLSDSHTLRVLLVDADENRLALWGSLLSYVGYRVSCARSAFEATLYLSADVQCVVLSDRLPDFDSLEYAGRLAIPGIREFVIVAGDARPSADEQPANSGVDAVFTSATASLQELVDAIELACRAIPHAPPIHVEPSSGEASAQSRVARSA